MAKIKEESGFHIYSFMRNDLDLKGYELLVYAIIYNFSQDGQSWCYTSQEYMAEWCGCGVSTIKRTIQKLCDAGLIVKSVKIENGKRMNEYKATKGVGQNDPKVKMNPTGGQNDPYQGVKMNHKPVIEPVMNQSPPIVPPKGEKSERFNRSSQATTASQKTYGNLPTKNWL